jgi:cell division protein FtsB
MKKRINTAIGWLDRARRKLATGAVVALLCVVAYYVVFAPNGLLAFHQKKTESQKLSDEIQVLQQDNARREQQIKALKSEPYAIEKEARIRLRYARPGEVVYTLPTAQLKPSPKK